MHNQNLGERCPVKVLHACSSAGLHSPWQWSCEWLVVADVLEVAASRAVGEGRGDIMFPLFKVAFRATFS